MGVYLAHAGLTGNDPMVHRAAFQVIAQVEGPAALADLDDHVTADTLLDLLEAREPGVATDAKWAAAAIGGDRARGLWLVENHSSASCIRCHIAEGRGGIAGPSLVDVGVRLSPQELLQSIIDPQAVVAEGYGNVSAMPEMQATLTPLEVRDIVAYLTTCQETLQ
jgi:mono/diheme cytochrome c family protein